MKVYGVPFESLSGAEHYQIKYEPCISDDQIAVSPDLFDAFKMLITNLSDSHIA